MAHQVDFSVPKRKLGKSDVEFEIKRDGRKVGTFTVSQGSVVWWPAYTTKGHKMGWQKFHDLMVEHATRIERR